MTGESEHELRTGSASGAPGSAGTSCHHCGVLIEEEPPPGTRRLACPRCGITLWKDRDRVVARSLAFAVTGLILFIPALLFPIFTFEVVGRKNSNLMITGVADLYGSGAGVIAVIVFLTSIAVPLFRFVAVVLITAPIAAGRPNQRTLRLNSLIAKLDNWAMLDVYLLAIVVTHAKLSNFGSMAFGPGWPALLGIILCSIAVTLCYSPYTIDRLAAREESPDGPEKSRSFSGDRRKPLVRCQALLLTGIILVVPSYTLTIMTIVQYGHVNHATVYGAVLELTAGGQYFLGSLMFVASIVVPIVKLIALSLLVLSIRLGWTGLPLARTRVYLFIERIGRWSFVDFFVVSMMVALAKLGVFATATAEPGLIVFAGVVLSTMFAAMSLDSRLFWTDRALVPDDGGSTRAD